MIVPDFLVLQIRITTERINTQVLHVMFGNERFRKVVC